MRATYKAVPRSSGCPRWYRLEALQYCCDAMVRAVDLGSVGFGDWTEPLMSRSTTINIYKIHCYPEGACADEIALAFCPWCKAEIVTEEIK